MVFGLCSTRVEQQIFTMLPYLTTKIANCQHVKVEKKKRKKSNS